MAQDLPKAPHAKQSYEASVTAIEAVMTELENETLIYDPSTEKTTMKNPAPLMQAPPKLRSKIVKTAKRLAFIESNLFTWIFRLDETITRLKTFLKRQNIEPEERQEAELLKNTLPEQGQEV